MVVGIQERYQQLLLTKIFYNRKVGTSGSGEERCRMCGKATESVPHILAGCGALAQSLYLARQNNALKILFFQVIRALDLVISEVRWFWKTQSMYENERAIAYWHIPLYADNTHVKANRIDATIVDEEKKKVSLIEMSCPWVENREEKDAEKTTKYGPLRWELEQRYPEYRVTQFNIMVHNGTNILITKVQRHREPPQELQANCLLINILQSTHINFNRKKPHPYHKE